ncbi:MAG: alpha/beta hydrolase [Pseudomonadota bacterium]
MAKIYFATNRDVRFNRRGKLKGFGKRFHKDGPQMFRVGEAMVQGADPFADKGWKVTARKIYPESKTKSKEVVGSANLFEGLRKRLKDGCTDMIIYLHGFANDFDNSAIRAAQLQSLYGEKGKEAIVVFFGWPSNGEVVPSFSNYRSDRHDAKLSGVAMARMLHKLVAFLMELRRQDQELLLAARDAHGGIPDPKDLKQCDRKIHVVAHSMGNWALRHAVLEFAELYGGRRLPRIFEHVFLMAADEDSDALSDREKLGMLLDLGNQIHVYHAKDDIPLQVSDRTKSNPDRLGAQGPEDLDLLDSRIVTVDCRDVSDTHGEVTHGRHQYYRTRKEVVQDVVATLRGEPQQGRSGRTETRTGRSWRIKDNNDKPHRPRK